ncbi:MAG: heme-binding protein [Sphingomonadales bacterium]|nr:heme-binding protein [Sphingomonadales bacterium]
MPTTPPEKPAKRKYVRKVPIDGAPKPSNAVKPAIKATKAPAEAKVAAPSPPAAPVAAPPVAAAAKPAPKAPAKAKVPSRRRSTPSTRAPVKQRLVPLAKLTIPPKPTVKQVAVVAASTGGIIAAVGAAFFLWRASKADQPDYKLIERDGDFEIREYPGLVTAATEAHGPRDAALERGFKTLADYIFAKSRTGDKIAMTAPVLSDGSSTSGWRTRFIMPAGKARVDLPAPPHGVTLANEPARRVAAVRFSGRADDRDLAAKEGALRSWLQLRAFPSEGVAEHAFYNSPVMPGPLRRNEVIITLSTK